MMTLQHSQSVLPARIHKLSSSLLLVALLSFTLLLPMAASASPSGGGRHFFFQGTSSTSGDSALGAGTLRPSFSVHGFGTVQTQDEENAASFSLTNLTFCSGGPTELKCLGLQGTVTRVIGNSINGAKVGDPVVAILVETSDDTGSTCIIIPAPNLGGICDNFQGTVIIP